jgi:hypothetical protein
MSIHLGGIESKSGTRTIDISKLINVISWKSLLLHKI